MSSAERLRKGMVLRHEGRTYMLMDFLAAPAGKQKAAVHLKFRMNTSTRQYLGEEH